MSRLPPILARDYRRQIIWPAIGLYLSLGFLAAIVFGVLR